jgi:cytoskeletal protein CcmA (bactofilin family)
VRDLFKEQTTAKNWLEPTIEQRNPMWTPARPISSPPQSATPRPVSDQMPGGALSTYIGKSLLIKGEVSGSEPIHVEGRIEGPISLPSSHLDIRRDGVVMSNVQAAEVVVQGTFHGKLMVSDRVEIHNGGSLIGEVTAGRVSIEDGACLQGSIDMRRPDPKAEPEFNSTTATDQQPPAVDQAQV